MGFSDEPSSREIESVIKLSPEARLEYLIKRVFDRDGVWAIRGPSGWLMMGGGTVEKALPVWPAAAFAKRHLGLKLESGGLAVVKIGFDHLLDVLLERLSEGGVKVAIFPVESSRTAILEPLEFRDRVRQYVSEWYG
ncbi:MAG: DUF2750 domain-containing protein [Sandaracinus sp.]|nr:DUF2750 domain-containing protein [Sandaracinus sp.]